MGYDDLSVIMEPTESDSGLVVKDGNLNLPVGDPDSSCIDLDTSYGDGTGAVNVEGEFHNIYM